MNEPHKPLMKNANIVWHTHKVSREDRGLIKKHEAVVLWFTGLSGSGKSTLANEIDCLLNRKGIHTYLLDGDNIRCGLNKDLGFSSEHRKENIRRMGEVAKLFVDAGLLTIVAFISPFAEDRRSARNLLNDGEFIEIYTKCPVEVCQKRDPKGFYEKAVKGEIKEFTGVTHPYEEPANPELLLETDKLSLNDCTGKIMDFLCQREIIK